ncbi:hypothetical protein FRB95_014882, partial [Tulasnella sp. JGI-2019a]
SEEPVAGPSGYAGLEVGTNTVLAEMDPLLEQIIKMAAMVCNRMDEDDTSVEEHLHTWIELNLQQRESICRNRVEEVKQCWTMPYQTESIIADIQLYVSILNLI